MLTDGFAFRIYLHCSRYVICFGNELNLTASPSTARHQPWCGCRETVTAPSESGLWNPAADVRLRVAHHDFVQALKVAAPLLAPVAQVAQRWVAMHMCSSQLSAEAVELCVAAAVSKTSSWSSAGATLHKRERDLVSNGAS